MDDLTQEKQALQLYLRKHPTTSKSEALLRHPEYNHLLRQAFQPFSEELMLYIHQIPFRYECALSLENTTFFPDFTIRHPLTGDYYYWEHFGLIDNPTYAGNALSKLQLYISESILPSTNLITTYETSNSPLDVSTVDRIIKLYFQE